MLYISKLREYMEIEY
jgi:5'-3' exonuclease